MPAGAPAPEVEGTSGGPSDDSAGTSRRPVAIRVLVPLAILQGLVLAGLGALLIAVRNSPEVAALGDAPAAVLAVGIVFVVLGLARIVLAALLLRRSEVARSWLGAVAVLQTAIGTYAVVGLQDAAASGLAELALSIGELWLLYGSEPVHEYFAR